MTPGDTNTPPATDHDDRHNNTQNTPTTGFCVCACCGAPARLHPADLEELAARIVERLGTAAPAAVETPRLVDAASLAERLGVSPAWVRDHAEELGVQRLGTGPRPRLRFDLDQAVKAYASSTAREGSRGPQTTESPVVARRATSRRRRAVRSSAQRVAVPVWEE